MNEHGDSYGEWVDRLAADETDRCGYAQEDRRAWERAVAENTVGDRAEWEAFARDMRDRPADPPPSDAEIAEMCRRAGYDFIPF